MGDNTFVFFKNRYKVAKLIINLVALAVKCSWVSVDRDIFMSVFSADGIGFAATS